MPDPRPGTPEFLALQRKWDARLAASGFRDLETRLSNGEYGPLLRGMSAGDLRRRLFRPDKEAYYRWARQHLHVMRPGPDGLHRRVWALHSEGTTVPKILSALRKRHPALTEAHVRRIIRWEEEEMRLAGDRAGDAAGAGDGDLPPEADLLATMAADLNPAGVAIVRRGSNKRGLTGE